MASLADGFADAVAARDLRAAAALLDPEVDFRAMTPNRVWEAATPADVEAVLRTWLEDPDEAVESIDATAPVAVQDVTRVGWLVHVRDADGPAVFEQQAYVREHAGRIAWMRLVCSGWRRLPPALDAAP